MPKSKFRSSALTNDVVTITWEGVRKILIIAILIVLVWLILEKKYKPVLSGTDYEELMKEYKLKRLMSFPTVILARNKYTPRLGYNRKTLVRIIEYYGKTESYTRLILHQATKISAIGLAVLFSLFVGAVAVVDYGYVIFFLFMAVSVFFLPDSMLSQKLKKRNLEIMIDFPDFIVRLTLMINAGMTVTKAWEKVSMDLGGRRALGRELEIAEYEIKSGKSAYKAYEDFSKRCRIQEVTRVVSVLLQNIKKGNSELVSVLRVHANECWEMRKNAAKKVGEEASSKMLLPMFLMFVSILLIVTTPAILAMQGLY